MADRWVQRTTATGHVLAVGFREIIAGEGETVTEIDSSAMPVDPTTGEEVSPVGTHTFDGSTFTEIVLTVSQVRASRRRELQGFIRDQERVPAMGLWAVEDPARAISFRRWVEGQVRAAVVDSNIDDDTKFAKMLGEAKIGGAFWYTHHHLAAWQIYRPEDRSGWTWWGTTAGTGTNTFGGAEDTSITLDRSSAVDWPEWLRGGIT